MGKFYLKTSEDVVPGVKLLRDYKKTAYFVDDDTPMSFVEGQKIGLAPNSLYKVRMYSDNDYEFNNFEAIAQEWECGVVIENSECIIVDGMDIIVSETEVDDEGNPLVEYVPAEGYWVIHNQDYLDQETGSVYFVVEGVNKNTGELLTRQEIGYVELPMESLPKQVQKVFNPPLNYTQEGFRLDLTTALNYGDWYYFSDSIGMCLGNEYDICLSPLMNDFEPLAICTVKATPGNIPGTIGLEYVSKVTPDGDPSPDGDSKNKGSKSVTIDFGFDNAFIDNYGNVQAGEGFIIMAQLLDRISSLEAIIELLEEHANISWEDLTEAQQEAYLQSSFAIFGLDTDEKPLVQKSIKTPTLQTNITGLARGIAGLNKPIDDLNNMAGIKGDSYSEFFNDNENTALLKGHGGRYSHTEGQGVSGYKYIKLVRAYSEEEINENSDLKYWYKENGQSGSGDHLYLYKDRYYFTRSNENDDSVSIEKIIDTKREGNYDYYRLSSNSGTELLIYPLHLSQGIASHVEGTTNFIYSTASNGHVQGEFNQILGGNSGFVTGSRNILNHTGANLLGYELRSAENYQTIVGEYNDSTSALFAIGNGTSDDNRSNALSAYSNGNLNIAGVYSNPGADYAEYYEWSDGNPNGEDRTGHFVTFAVGNKIRLAQPDDAYILGVVSATPTIVGNSYKEQWQGKYMRDVYGRILTETIEHEEVIIRSEQEEVLEIIPAYTEVKPILNPEYDPTQEYVGRDKRPEWSPVGTHGQLVVLDDGTCQVDSFCALGSNGMATAAAGATPYRVIERLDDTHVKVVLK